MEHEPYVAYKEDAPLVKSRPWAFVARVDPESKLGKRGVKTSVWNGYRTKKDAQSAADAHRRAEEAKVRI